MATILDSMDELYEVIYENRTRIATLKKEKINLRSDAWSEATGTAKEKEDFVRSAVSLKDEEIFICEAEIERAYNKIKLYEFKLEYGDGQ